MAVAHQTFKQHWEKTIAGMQAATAQVLAVWMDPNKDCKTERAKLLQELQVRLMVAISFVKQIDNTETRMNQAGHAIMTLDKAAQAAAICWQQRKGHGKTSEQLAAEQAALDAEHAEFEKHRMKLTFTA